MTDLRERFEHDLADLRPPPGFESTVLEQGRRLRTRRRLVRTAGGLTTIGIATAAAVVVLGGSHGEARDPGFADDAPPPAPSLDATQPLPSGWWDMPAKRMLTELRAALPEGVAVTGADLTSDGIDGPIKAIGSLSGVLTADTGPGSFQILLYPPEPPVPPDPVTTTDADGNTHTTVQAGGETLAQRIRCRDYMTSCQTILDDFGAVMGRVSTDTDQGTTYYEVALLGPDGGGLNLTVMDSSGEKPGYEAPSASEPPLTPEELVALAQDPAWTEYAPAG